MAPSPIVIATIQSAVVGAASCLLGQVISAYRKDVAVVFDWVPVAQFFIICVITAPPNFLWQQFLEETWPAMVTTPPTTARPVTEKKMAGEPGDHRAGARLSVGNTVIKALLDQSVGAVVNSYVFVALACFLRQGMVQPGHGGSAPGPGFLLSGQTYDFAAVDWRVVMAEAAADFWPLLVASWQFWPFVSVVNYVFLKTAMARNVLANTAGVAWGVYLSLR